MDLRQAAEDRARQTRQQTELFQREKDRHSRKHRASSATSSSFSLNPEERVEADEGLADQQLYEEEEGKVVAFDPVSQLNASSSSHISPYKETNQRYSLRLQSQQQRQSLRMAALEEDTPRKESLTEMLQDNVRQDNITPTLAKLAASEYKLNGARARAGSGEYIRPRWIPDEAMDYCLLCSTSFTVVNRRHHCRHCGNLVCDSCSSLRALLPAEFGLRDPQRVCKPCFEALEPLQSSLIVHLANHERENEVVPILDSDGADLSSCTAAALGRGGGVGIGLGAGSCSQLRRYSNLPFSLTLGSEVRKAAYSIYNLFHLTYLQDRRIPLTLLARAQGIAFLTVAKAGFLLAPKIGTGLVIARLPSPSTDTDTNTDKGADPFSPAALANVRWSAPSAIGTIGLSCGAVFGVDITDYVIILNTSEAVEAFCSSGQVTLGGSIDIAVGPVGRSGSGDVHISANGLASAYSYSHSRGIFAGVALDGAVIVPRPGVNANFYGRAVTSSDLLHGLVSPPRAAKPLYLALQEALAAIPAVEHSTPSPLPMINKLANFTATNPTGIAAGPVTSGHLRRTTSVGEKEEEDGEVIDLQSSTRSFSERVRKSSTNSGDER